MVNEELVRPAAWARRAVILLIDDDPCVAEALAFVLECNEYRVQRCNDALEALAILRAGDLPDLILLDLVMPKMSGWEFRIEQRRDATLASIPVIALSADNSPQAAAINADGYLQKPVDERMLLESVESLLATTRQKRAEERHAELERLSSLGLIAAGIAHEINNPLSFVIGNLELARKHARELEGELTGLQQARMIAMNKLMDQADRGAQRIADVVRSVSAFSRPDTDALLAINVVDVLESSIQLVGNELRHHARLERSYERVPEVLGNPAKLGQVFLNLLTNAVHALESDEHARREITVSTRGGERGEAIVSISDTGRGIPKALVSRIFDPFFSTKPVGGGMGLGLAISHRIVTNMGGSIRVHSEPGSGSTFEVILPGVRTSWCSSETLPEHAPESDARPRRARVLVIDDEQMMCELLEVTLGAEYEVCAVMSAREALARVVGGESYDVIVCDLMMPELSGMDVHAELSRTRPDQAERMLFMTGGTFTDRARRFVERLAVGCLEKPFRPPEVRDMIEMWLRERGLLGDGQRGMN